MTGSAEGLCRGVYCFHNHRVLMLIHEYRFFVSRRGITLFLPYGIADYSSVAVYLLILFQVLFIQDVPPNVTSFSVMV